MPGRHAPETIRRLTAALTDLRADMVGRATEAGDAVRLAAPAYRQRAENLLHYVALRDRDLRDLKSELSRLGLSSLGRTEAHAMAGIESPLYALCRIAGIAPPVFPTPSVDHDSGASALVTHAEDLFGPAPVGRAGRIRVTGSTELADDDALAQRLIAAGADLLRVNAAHDDRAVWERMIGRMRAAAAAAGRPLRVLFDLAGPKLRTGAVTTEEDVVHWRPRHDRRGTVVHPARVRLCAVEAAAVAALRPSDQTLTADAALVKTARLGDRVTFQDCRGRNRGLVLAEDDGVGGFIGLADHGAYVEAGTPLRLERGDRTAATGSAGPFPPRAVEILLRPGDELVVTPPAESGHPARRSQDGAVLIPARIPCTLPEVFSSVEAGQRIWFDDGKIGGVVERATAAEIRVRIRHARPGGSRLLSDKGIILPNTDLRLPALTQKDLIDLDFAAKHADIIGLSFLRDANDVLELEEALDHRGAQGRGLMLKIENARAFERLPRILLAALRSPPVGVMIARGDLAVEVGFERLAEVQEEILWICEAAHVPVVWATQVLESLAKKGAPSRAEVTDAAMSGRAECVMLNKGPHADLAVRFLDDVLRRMALHQHKKTAMLRRLGVSRRGE